MVVLQSVISWVAQPVGPVRHESPPFKQKSPHFATRQVLSQMGGVLARTRRGRGRD